MSEREITPYREVNDLMELLRDEVRRILGSHFVGLYLHGSLASGDFDPASSDIDFLVVTDTEIPPALLPMVEAMHAQIAQRGLPYGDHLEGSYIPLGALRRYNPANAEHPSIGVDWPFMVGEHGESWVLNRHILREHGVVIEGPPPESLIDPVSVEELQSAVRSMLTKRWAFEPYDPERFGQRLYQAFAVLTMCRALVLLETGRFVSKPEAAKWGIENLEPRWKRLIERALTWRHDPARDDMSGTLAFITYTVDRAMMI